MKLSYLYPLVGFVVPTVIIGYGFAIPKSCIAGINDLTIGFTVTIMSACITYWIGPTKRIARSCLLAEQRRVP
jgi:hypothetical protein